MVEIITFWGMRLITALAILIAGWVIGKFCVEPHQNIQKLDDTLKSFLGGFAKYAILAIALVAVLGQLGVQTASLLAVLGAAGLAIGLALQGTLSTSHPASCSSSCARSASATTSNPAQSGHGKSLGCS